MKKYISHILGYMRPGRRAVVAASLGLALGISVIIIFLKTSGKGAEASAWMDDNWLYRTAYNITNSSSAINAERKIKLDIDTAALITAGKMQSDCDDARFTDATGKQLDYFIDTDTGACNTNSTDFYIKVPAVIAGKQTIFFYYGNSTAARTRKNDFFAPDTTGQGLKAYFPMDEASANTCTGGSNDTCDYALTNDGAWNGNVASTTGKISNGTTYDGTGDYISINDNSVINNMSNATIALWVYFNNLSSTQIPIAKDGDSGYYMQFNTNGSLYLRYGSAAITVGGAGTITAGTWTHVALHFNGTTITGYKNGSALATTTTGSAPTGMNDKLWIGGYSTNNDPVPNSYFLNGQVDDVRIYNRALSGSEISAIYNSGNGQSLSVPLTFTQSATAAASEEQSPGPVAAWSFDEGQGTTAYDSTSNSNNGTLTNGPVWKNESDCISGKCLYFDGSNDYISVADNSLLNPINNSFTASVWLRPNGLQAAQTGIFSKNNGDYYIFEINSSNLIAYEIRDNSGAGNYFSGKGNNSLNNNQWNHVSWVLDRTNQNIYLYLNGKLDKTISISTMDEDINPSGGALNIGSHTGYFKGSIDEPRIYPYARTAAQIRADYAARGTSQGVEAQIGDNGAVDQLSNGLVAYYPMDEAAANTCSGGVNDTCDRSGNSNDGAWTNGATTTSGKYGNGVSFDGTDDYILASDTDNLDLINTRTFSFWIKPNNATNTHRIIRKGNPYNSAGRGYSILYRGDLANDPLEIQLNDTTDGCLVGPSYNVGNISNTWTHVTVSLNTQTQKAQWYINGDYKEEDTFACTGSFNSSSGMEIGSTAGDTLYGALDDVRIYNRALSPAEVAALYNWAPGPVAHWKLDENTGTSATDTSGNSNTGTLTNGPVWAQGKFGNAVKFDGTNDYIDSGDTSTLKLTSSGTIGTWIYPTAYPTSGNWKVILNKGNWGSGLNYYSIYYLGTGNYLRFDLGNASTTNTIAIANTLTPLNSWSYVSMTWDGSTIKAYINGIQISSTSQTVTPDTSSYNFQLGTANNSASYVLSGTLDDVRVYNYALNSKQIANIMNGQDVNAAAVGSPVGHPVAHWSFDEGYGTTTYNKIRGNGDLTLWKGPSATNYPLWKNTGKFGKALQFSSSEYPENNNTSTSYQSWMNSASASWNFWIYPTNLSGTSRILSRHFQTGSGYIYEIRMYTDEIQILASSDCTAGATQTLNSSNVNFALNTWQHIVVNHESGTGFKIYKNGTLTDTITYTSGICTSNTSNGVYLGTDVGVNGHLDAYLDEVKIYNYALSKDEVNLEYNRGAATVFGSTSTASDGITADNSAGREYCVPGDTSSCAPPVAEWKLDEGTGTTGNDTSGNGNTGTLTNGPTWTNGKFGKAVSFDGSNDYVAVGTSFSDSIESTGSISAWAYRTGIGGALFNRSTGSSWTDERLVLAYFRSDSSTWGWAMSNGTNYQNPEWAISTFPSNEWVHLAINWNGTTVNTYLNGSLFDSRAQQYTPEITGIDTWIGRTQGLGNGYFPGKIDNIRIYNYARTPAQIAWEYNRGAPVAHYKLDECQGTTAYNAALSGNGQAAGSNGTITIGASGTNTSAGTCTGSAGEAWKDGATGKLGASLEFDGSDDYVSIADPGTNSILDANGKAISVAAWIKGNDFSGTYHGLAVKTTIESYGLWSYQDDLMCGFTIDGSIQRRTHLANFSTGTWYHVMCTYDGSAIKAYINGVLKETWNYSGSVISPENNPLLIGYSGYSTEYFNGQIDDVRIYNYALTPVQVRDVYNGGAVSFK